jgi:hypothetical protein
VTVRGGGGGEHRKNFIFLKIVKYLSNIGTGSTNRVGKEEANERTNKQRKTQKKELRTGRKKLGNEGKIKLSIKHK